VNLPFGLALLAFLPAHTLEPDAAAYFTALKHPFALAYIALAGKLMVLAGVISALQCAPRYVARLDALAAPERLFLLAGAMIISFCFCVAQNLDYRGIFLLLTLPALVSLRMAGDRELRLFLVAVLLLLWEGMFRHLAGHVGYPVQVLVWLGREYLWWWVVVRLLAICICWLRTLTPRRTLIC
jgi:hypothetical protein